VTALQAFVADDPDAGIEIDVDRERLVYDGCEVPVAVDDSTRSALVEGNWDTTAVMRSNLDRACATHDGLPYEAGADGDGRRRSADGGGDR
jgi:3-isopropylmalate/(R)-2-methylmalate dehydratase small subunit